MSNWSWGNVLQISAGIIIAGLIIGVVFKRA